MNAKHEERLLKLAEILETEVKPKTFDLSVYYLDHPSFPCGYAACAVGHAMFHPWFRKRGLINELNPMNHDVPYIKKSCLSGTDAVMEFFGIDRTTYEGLFTLAGYPFVKDITPKIVAKKIRKYVQDEKKRLSTLKS